MARVKNQETHDKLIEAGLRSFMGRGYHGSGLKEILDLVDVPKGSFYAYFSSKEEFAVEVIRHYSSCFGRSMDEVIRKHRSPRRGLLAFLRELARSFEEDDFKGGCLIANLTGEIDESEPCREALRQGFQDWQNQVEAVIAHGQELGEFRKDLPASRMAAILVDSWEGAVLRMKAARSSEPLLRVIDHLLEDYFTP